MTWLRVRIVILTTCVLGGADMPAFAQSVADWITWNSGPNASRINGECWGNCGAGWSPKFNVCGGRAQFWQLQIISPPQSLGTESYDVICDGFSLWWRHAVLYQAWGRWTYHGYAAIGCQIHDSFCPEVLWGLGCAV